MKFKLKVQSKARVNELITLLYLAALECKEGHLQFLQILTFSRESCLFLDDQTIVPLELKFLGFRRRHLHTASTWQFWQIFGICDE